MKTDKTVAATIAQQIGHKALVMIGASNICAGDNCIVMKIGRNSKGWNYLKIALNGLDLYDMTFQRIRNCKIADEKVINDIYHDQLCDIIERETGLNTSL